MPGADHAVRPVTTGRVPCLTVQSVLRLVGRSTMLVLALFLSLLVVVLDGSAGAPTTINWIVPLLLVVWATTAYLGHLRARWVRRGAVAAAVSGTRRLHRGEIVGAGAAVVGGVAAAVVARTLADAPAVPLVFSTVLGAVVGLLASDILGRLGWLQ